MLNCIQIHLAGPSALLLTDVLTTAGNDFMLKRLDPETLEVKQEMNLEEEAHCLALCHDSIYWAGEGEKLFRLMGQESAPVGQVLGRVRRLLAHQATLLVLADLLSFWEAGALKHQFEYIDGILDVALGGGIIFILTKWELQVRSTSGESLLKVPMENGEQARMSFCHESSRLVLPGERVRMMDTSQQMEEGIDIGVRVEKVFALDSQMQLLQGEDMKIRLVYQGRVLREIPLKDWLQGVAYKPDTQIVYVLNAQGELAMFSAGLNRELATLNEQVAIEEEKEEEEQVVSVPAKKREEPERETQGSHRPQGLFQNGQCSNLQKHRRILCWSLVGLVYLRESETNAGQEFVNIELADQNRHSNMVMANKEALCMAVLSPSGCLLASSLAEEDMDEYEEERKESSVVVYKSFQTGGDWRVSLPEEESAQLLALSAEYASVATDLQLLRVYAMNGVCLHALCIEKPLVSLSAYEHHLACVTLDSTPLFKCQNLKLTVYSLSGHTLDTCHTLALPLSVGAFLKHLHYSSEGMLVSQDTHGLIRALVAHNYWTLLHDNDHRIQHKGTKQFYLMAVNDYQLLGTFLPPDEEPAVMPKPVLTQVELRVAMECFQKTRLQHEAYREKEYSQYQREQSLSKQHKNILSQAQRLESHSQMDKQALHLLRSYLVENDYEKALVVAQSQLYLPKSVQVAIQLVTRLELIHLVGPLQDVLHRKQPVEQVLDTEVPPVQKPKRQYKHGLSLQKLSIQHTQITPITQEDIQSQLKPRESIMEEPEEPSLNRAVLQENPFRAQEEESKDYNIFKEFQRGEVNKRIKP